MTSGAGRRRHYGVTDGPGAAPGRISEQQAERLLRLVAPLQRFWVPVVLVAALLSTISVERKPGGGWSVDFHITTVTAVLVGLVWLPAVIRLVALAGGGVKTPAGEFTTGGIGALLGSLDTGETTVRELAPPEALRATATLAEQPSAAIEIRSAGSLTSYAQTLVEQILQTTPADYAVVDVGAGDRWLTSRLYLFADLLARMRDLRCFVFVRSIGAAERRFVGTGLSWDVRFTLAEQYPWLEQAYAQAYAELPRHEIRSAHGRLSPEDATALVQKFVARVQADPPAAPSADWVALGPGTWEHAAWVGPDLPAGLESVLSRASVAVGDDDRVTRDVLARSGERFVALVGPDEAFERLVDRQALLEQTAARLAQTAKVMAAAPD